MVRTKLPKSRKSASKRKTKGSKRKVGRSKYPGLKKASLRYRTVVTTYASAISRCWRKSPTWSKSQLKAKLRSFTAARKAATKARAAFRKLQHTKISKGNSVALKSRRRKALIRFRKRVMVAYAKGRQVLALARKACYARNVIALHKRPKGKGKKKGKKSKKGKKTCSALKRWGAAKKRSVSKRRYTVLRWGATKKRSVRRAGSKRPRTKLARKTKRRTARRSGALRWGATKRRSVRRHYADWEPLEEGDYSDADW